MRHWSDKRLNALGALDHAQQSYFVNLPGIIRDLNFEYWSYCVVDPAHRDRILLMHSNLPSSWRRHYIGLDVFAEDPRVVHGLISLQPLRWQPSLFNTTPRLWQAMCAAGVTEGMTQACHHSSGLVAILCVCRATELLGVEEFEAIAHSVLALANHLTVASIEKVANDPLLAPSCPLAGPLTRQELTILQKTSTGQTAADIAGDMSLSQRTVQFHISSTITKLNVPNKTAAVAQAILLNLFDRL